LHELTHELYVPDILVAVLVTMLPSSGDGDVHRVGGGAINPPPTEEDDAVTVDVIIADKPAAVDFDPLVVIDDEGSIIFDVAGVFGVPTIFPTLTVALV
jgi:hypothetical protein